MEDEPETYQSHFVECIKRGLEPDDLEELYKKVHAAIRADPSPKKSDKPPCKEHKRLVSREGSIQFVMLYLYPCFSLKSIFNRKDFRN